jgi:hypothetical protein
MGREGDCATNFGLRGSGFKPLYRALELHNRDAGTLSPIVNQLIAYYKKILAWVAANPTPVTPNVAKIARSFATLRGKNR